MTLAVLTTALVLFLYQDTASKPKPQDCPMHDAHAQMNERGEHAMGFSQTATTHHFLLKPDGGVIQVEANNPKDTSSRDNIRMHLGHIAKMFADGDFNISDVRPRHSSARCAGDEGATEADSLHVRENTERRNCRHRDSG
jgi:hypothetical protein